MLVLENGTELTPGTAFHTKTGGETAFLILAVNEDFTVTFGLERYAFRKENGVWAIPADAITVSFAGFQDMFKETIESAEHRAAKKKTGHKEAPVTLTDEQALDVLMDVVDRAGNGEDIDKLEKEFVTRLGM